MKKRGISLLAVIIIFIIMIVLIIFVINICKGNINIALKRNNDIEEKPKFSIEMLDENGIGKENSIDQLKQKFGNISKKSSYVEVSTKENVNEYTGDGVFLKVKDNKLSTVIVTNENFEFNGIKIGDSEEKLISSFYQENNNEEVKDIDNKVIGTYIYGTYNINNLEEMKITDNVEYAYIGNESNDNYDYIIHYVCMEPPYKGEYATKEDTVAYIEFGIKNGIITTFGSEIT